MNVEEAMHGGDVQLREVVGVKDPGVIDQYVDAAKRVDRVLDDGLAPAGSATSELSASAMPPADRIADTTSWAGPLSTPTPSAPTPRSLTITRAPRDASSWA